MLTPLTGPVSLTDAMAKPVSELSETKGLRKQLRVLRKRMGALQHALGAEGRRSMLIVLQGRDAGGKDGTIRRVFGALNPATCRVTSFKRPTPVELAHDYLWRIHRQVPPRGMIGIFNRSHYEDVLPVRVHQLVPEAIWRARYDQINAFESHLVANDVTILKFFLHISRDEQRKRLEERLEDPASNWKFEEGDLKEREKWDEYTAAYAELLARCSSPSAPWFLVPADQKRVRNVLIAQTVIAALKRLDPKYPAADPNVLAYRGKIV